MHEAPSVFNYRTPDRGEDVKPGLVLAIEPMVTAGGDATFIEEDDWTVTTVTARTAPIGNIASPCMMGVSGC